MFTIIGGDGKEYGPATAAQVRAWMAAGRANGETKAKAVGSDEWRRIEDFPEFSSTGTDAPPEIVGTEPQLADRLTRLFARMIDWAIRYILTLPGAILIGPEVTSALIKAMQTGSIDMDLLKSDRVVMGASLLFVAMALLLVVQVVLLSLRGQSIGKMLVRVRIVRIADGAKAGFTRAWLLREFVESLLGFIPFVGLLISPLFTITDWMFIFRQDRRCIHDFIAGTVVVKA